jgi:GNAT superfamily N-acetyltransferase
MLQVQKITRESKDLDVVKALYFSAFPESEQAPMEFLLQKAEEDYVRFSAYYDEGVFVGLSYTITREDLTYLLYMAVSGSIRSKGYGTQILSCIKEFRPDNRIILNIDPTDESAANNEERIRRRNFYIRNGYSPSNIVIEMNGNTFDVLSSGACTADEFRVLFKKYLGADLFDYYGTKIFSK